MKQLRAIHVVSRLVKLRQLTQDGVLHHVLPLVIVVLFAVAGTGYLVLTHADTPTASNSITSGWSAKLCLDDWKDLRVNAGKIDIYDCNNSNAQEWTYNTTSKTINLNGYDICIGANDSPVFHSQPVVQTFVCRQTADLPSSNQQWVPEPGSGDELHNVHTGLCMTAPGSNGKAPAKGTSVVLTACSNPSCTSAPATACPDHIVINPAQEWKFTATGGAPSGGNSVAMFVPAEGWNVPKGQTVAYLGVTVPASEKVDHVTWSLEVNGTPKLEATRQQPAAPGLYQYGWQLAGLPSGTYRWSAEVFTSPTAGRIVVNNKGDGFVDLVINNPGVVSGTFVQTENASVNTPVALAVKVSNPSLTKDVQWLRLAGGNINLNPVWVPVCTTTTQHSTVQSEYICNWSPTAVSQKGLQRLEAYIVDKSSNSQKATNPQNKNADYIDLNIK